MGTQRTVLDKRCVCGECMVRVHRKSPFIDASVDVCTNRGDAILMRPKCPLAEDPEDILDRSEAAGAAGTYEGAEDSDE